MKSLTYIIPHYNSFERIRILLDSIVLKDNDEIIVIDDCSTDGSYQLLSKHVKNIKLLRTSENSGAGKARNIGLKHAKNDWVIFSDADDHFTEAYRDQIELYINTTKDVIYFKPISEQISVNTSMIGDPQGFYAYLIEKYLEKPTETNLNKVKYRMVVPWSKMINIEFLRENNILFDEVPIANDTMFSTKIGYFAKNVVVSNNTIYCYMESNTSLTADTSYEKMLLRLPIFAAQYQFLRDNLSKKELNKMGITGFGVLVLALRKRYSFSEFVSLIKFYKENNIPLVTINYFFMRTKRLLKV